MHTKLYIKSDGYMRREWFIHKKVVIKRDLLGKKLV